MPAESPPTAIRALSGCRQFLPQASSAGKQSKDERFSLRTCPRHHESPRRGSCHQIQTGNHCACLHRLRSRRPRPLRLHLYQHQQCRCIRRKYKSWTNPPNRKQSRRKPYSRRPYRGSRWDHCFYVTTSTPVMFASPLMRWITNCCWVSYLLHLRDAVMQIHLRGVEGVKLSRILPHALQCSDFGIDCVGVLRHLWNRLLGPLRCTNGNTCGFYG